MNDFDRRRDLEHDFVRMALAGVCFGVVDIRDLTALCPVDHVHERVPRAIYAAMRDTVDAGIAPTLDSVYRTLHETPQGAEITAHEFSTYAVSVYGKREDVILHTAQRVRDEAAKRLAESKLAALESDCRSYDAKATDIAHALAGIAESMEGGISSAPGDLAELMGRVVAAAERGDVAKPMPTPWPSLNRVLKGGIVPGELAVLAARPGMGKTALAGCIAVEAARSGRRVLFISREVKDVTLGFRFAAREARVDVSIFRQHASNGPAMLPAIKAAAAKLSKLPLSVVEKSIAPMTPTEVRRLARGLHGRDGSRVGLVVVDYLQLLTPDAKATSREREVAEMSRAFKQLALDCDCPVLLLSQLNRSVEESDRSPQLSDLRESGAIEQDADIVLFLHAKRSFRGLPKMPVQAIVAKGRSSGTGAAGLIFHKPFSDFYENDGTTDDYSRPHADDDPDF